jgi:hypothetical protein
MDLAELELESNARREGETGHDSAHEATPSAEWQEVVRTLNAHFHEPDIQAARALAPRWY